MKIQPTTTVEPPPVALPLAQQPTPCQTNAGPPSDSQRVARLLAAFDASTLGEGDAVAGADVLTAMACSRSPNIHRHGSGLVTEQGERLAVGTSLLISGCHSSSLVGEKITNVWPPPPTGPASSPANGRSSAPPWKKVPRSRLTLTSPLHQADNPIYRHTLVVREAQSYKPGLHKAWGGVLGDRLWHLLRGDEIPKCLPEESGAVISHAGICGEGRWATGVPTHQSHRNDAVASH